MSTCDKISKLLGHLLTKAASTPAADRACNEYGADSWIDGGCHMFAAALQKWLGVGEPVGLYRGRNLQHVMLKIGECYFDASGASSAEAALSRWNGANRIEPADLEALAIEWPIADELVRIFKTFIGDGREVAADL